MYLNFNELNGGKMGEVKEVKKILQIIPSEDWYMITSKETLSELVCWALCEDKNGNRFVSGMFRGPDGDPTLFPCSEVSIFSYYSKKADE